MQRAALAAILIGLVAFVAFCLYRFDASPARIWNGLDRFGKIAARAVPTDSRRRVLGPGQGHAGEHRHGVSRHADCHLHRFSARLPGRAQRRQAAAVPVSDPPLVRLPARRRRVGLGARVRARGGARPAGGRAGDCDHRYRDPRRSCLRRRSRMSTASRSTASRPPEPTPFSGCASASFRRCCRS